MSKQARAIAFLLTAHTAAALAATSWLVAPPRSAHTPTVVLAFGALAWSMYFALLAPIWLPHVLVPKARWAQLAMLVVGCLILGLSAFALGLAFVCVERFKIWAVGIALLLLVVATLFQAFSAFRRFRGSE
jgi:hypothetical protein